MSKLQSFKNIKEPPGGGGGSAGLKNSLAHVPEESVSAPASKYAFHPPSSLDKHAASRPRFSYYGSSNESSNSYNNSNSNSNGIVNRDSNGNVNSDSNSNSNSNGNDNGNGNGNGSGNGNGNDNGNNNDFNNNDRMKASPVHIPLVNKGATSPIPLGGAFEEELGPSGYVYENEGGYTYEKNDSGKHSSDHSNGGNKGERATMILNREQIESLSMHEVMMRNSLLQKLRGLYKSVGDADKEEMNKPSDKKPGFRTRTKSVMMRQATSLISLDDSQKDEEDSDDEAKDDHDNGMLKRSYQTLTSTSPPADKVNAICSLIASWCWEIRDPRAESIPAVLWNMLLGVVLMYNLVEIPLRSFYNAFPEEEFGLIEALNLFSDLLFLMDIVRQFRLGFWEGGAFIRDPRVIARRYVFSWFAVDLVTSFPFDFILKLLGFQGAFVDSLRYYRILKITRMIKLFKMIQRVENSTSLVGFLTRIFKMVLIVFLVGHLSASLLLVSALTDRDDETRAFSVDSWPVRDLGIASMDDISVFRLYAFTFYWALQTIATVGYGDITPNTTVEIWVFSVVIFIGTIAFGYILTNVTHFVTHEGISDRILRVKLMRLDEFMICKKIPNDLRAQIRTHYEYSWQMVTSSYEKEIMSDLPQLLRRKLTLVLYADLIANVPFLGSIKSKECVSLLVSKLVPLQLSPGQYVYRRGSYGSSMFINQEGEIALIINTLVVSVFPGQYFGEAALFVEHTSRRAESAQACTFTRLLDFSKGAYEEVVALYPFIHEDMYQAAINKHIELSHQLEEERQEYACSDSAAFNFIDSIAQESMMGGANVDAMDNAIDAIDNKIIETVVEGDSEASSGEAGKGGGSRTQSLMRINGIRQSFSLAPGSSSLLNMGMNANMDKGAAGGSSLGTDSDTHSKRSSILLGAGGAAGDAVHSTRDSVGSGASRRSRANSVNKRRSLIHQADFLYNPSLLLTPLGGSEALQSAFFEHVLGSEARKRRAAGPARKETLNMQQVLRKLFPRSRARPSWHAAGGMVPLSPHTQCSPQPSPRRSPRDAGDGEVHSHRSQTLSQRRRERAEAGTRYSRDSSAPPTPSSRTSDLLNPLGSGEGGVSVPSPKHSAIQGPAVTITRADEEGRGSPGRSVEREEPLQGPPLTPLADHRVRRLGARQDSTASINSTGFGLKHDTFTDSPGNHDRDQPARAALLKPISADKGVQGEKDGDIDEKEKDTGGLPCPSPFDLNSNSDSPNQKTGLYTNKEKKDGKSDSADAINKHLAAAPLASPSVSPQIRPKRLRARVSSKRATAPVRSAALAGSGSSSSPYQNPLNPVVKKGGTRKRHTTSIPSRKGLYNHMPASHPHSNFLKNKGGRVNTALNLSGVKNKARQRLAAPLGHISKDSSNDEEESDSEVDSDEEGGGKGQLTVQQSLALVSQQIYSLSLSVQQVSSSVEKIKLAQATNQKAFAQITSSTKAEVAALARQLQQKSGGSSYY